MVLRSGDLDDRRYMKELIRTFVRAVYVYDDKLRILFNYGKEMDFSRSITEESTNDGDPGTCSRQVSNGAPEKGLPYGSPFSGAQPSADDTLLRPKLE